MKRSLSLLPVFLGLAALALTSCKKDTPEQEYDLYVVDFEEAELSGEGYLVGEAYTEKDIVFGHEYDTQYGSWSGFAVSNNTDKTTAGYGNQYSVYADHGAKNSANFAVGYIYGECEFHFENGKERIVEYAYINNSTYAALAILNGDQYAKKFEDGDRFLLTVTGYNAAGTKTADVEVILAGFHDGDEYIMSEWTKLHLTGLGKVNKVAFVLSSTDNTDYDGVSYMNTPAYFCIDNIAYREPVE